MDNKELTKLLTIKNNLEKTLLLKKARKHFPTFCEYVFGLKLGRIHKEWHALATKAMKEGAPCVIFAPRSHAKCQIFDTVITLTDGSLKKVKDCKIGESIIAYDVENCKFVSAKITAIVDNGIKDVYEIKLASGKSIEVTSNHPFLTADGWKSLEEGLTVGEKVAVPLHIPRINTKKHFTDNQLIILACLIADGSLSSGNLVYTKSNKFLVNKLNEALLEFGCQLIQTKREIEYRITNISKEIKGRKKLIEFLKKYNLYGKRSYEKEIPKELFNSPEEDIKLFLKYLWLGDGYISKVKRKKQKFKNDTVIAYTTTSKNLAYQVQTLLEYIGIPSNICVRQSYTREYYTITVFGGKEFKLKFLKEVLNKKTEDILEYVENAAPSTYATIPRQLVLQYLPLTPHFIRKYYGLRIDNKYDITYDKLRKLVELFPNIPELRMLLNAPIRWDKIVKIEYKGKKPTIGLEIEKYHNHITNGIITHNTTVMSVMRPLFLLGHNPNLRIKLVSHSDKKAADILRQIKEAIEGNEKLKEIFPHLEPGDVWASNKILIKRDIWSKDVTIESLGVLSGATGGRCVGKGTLIITSNGVKPVEEITTKDTVLTKEGKFRRVIKTWKRPYKGKVIVIETKNNKNNKIILTPEHKIYLLNKEKNIKEWVSCKCLLQNRKNYCLIFPNEINQYIEIELKTIYEEDYNGYVYDLSVDTEHSFCSIWAILHNSDYIIFDDIVEFNNTIKYPALIPMVKEAFYNNWLNLLEPDGYGWCLIGTIWTQMDLHWEFHEKPMKYKKVYRIDLNTLEPIWEERWTKEKLLERYNSMPLRAFARAFGNLPISREDAVFDKEKIENCIVYNDPKHYLKKCDYIIMGVDLAISQKKKSANTAIFIMGLLPKKKDYKLVALHIEYGKWTSPETVNAIMKLYKDWKVDVIVVESNQYQEALKQWLEEFKQDLPVESHYTGGNKHDPEIGLPAMALEFEKQRWIIPMGKKPHESDCKCGKCKWIEELTMYPFGENDDIVMASWFAREYWRKHRKYLEEDIEVESW